MCIMTIKYDDSLFDALTRWAYDTPPLGRPGSAVRQVCFGRSGSLPEIMVDDQRFPVVGITPSGWLSSAGFGWCRFTGHRDDITRIAIACNPAQLVLARDRVMIDAALNRYLALPQDQRIGGLPVTVLDDGRRVVRLTDITEPSVRAEFEAALLDPGLADDADPHAMSQADNSMPPGHVDAELWWSWCRIWSGRTE